MRIVRQKTAYLFLCAGVAGLLAPGICHAQAVAPAAEPAQSDQLDDIVVTAERRKESSQTVPLSILALSGEAIASSGYRDITDLQYLAPGVQYDPTQGAAFQIRGVGTTSFDRSNPKSVSVVVDDGVMDGQRVNGMIGMTDLERIEVLMGPQGTLFGKNATSGVISVTTGQPRLGDTSLRASASYGEHSDRDLNATINLPIGEQAAFRLSAFDQAQDGFGRNVTLYKLVGSFHDYGARAKLLVAPNDGFDITLRADYAHHWDSSVRTPVSVTNPTVAALLKTHGIVPGPENADTADSNYGFIETEEWGASARINVKLGDHELSSISAYRFGLYNNNTPANLLPVNEYAYVAYNYGHTTSDKVSQEFHLASPQDQRVTYLLGLFYNRLESNATQLQWMAAQGAVSPAKPMLLAISGAKGQAGNTWTFDAVNETMAAFGQVKFALTDGFSVTLGGRYTHDNNSQGLGFTTTDPTPIVGFTPVITPYSNAPAYPFGRAKSSNFSWRAAPEWRIGRAAMLYASYATGYKPAGVAFSAGVYAPYRQESVKAWEVGLKSEWLNHRLRFNIDAFRSDFTDFQATILTKVPDGLGGTILATAIGNAGGLRSQGIETSIVARVAKPLTLGLSGTYTDAKFTNYVYNATTDYTGTRLPNAPQWAFTATADLDQSVGAHLRLKAHADYAWRGEYWTVVGQPDYSHVPSFGLVNARLGVAADRYEVGLYARNLLDTYFSTGYQIYGAIGLLHYTSPNARRTAGAFVNLKF